MPFIDELMSQRQAALAAAQQILAGASAQNRRTLTPDETRRFETHRADIERINGRLEQLGDDFERRSAIDNNPVLAQLRGKTGTVERRGGLGSAARLAPLSFGDEEMRRMQDAAQRGDPCRIETRAFSTADSLIPATLYPYPVEAIHESRLMDRLPGIAFETPAITFIRHISTTGATDATAEGAIKPELVFNTDALTEDAVKLAGNVGLSYEIINDFVAFQQYAGAELYKQIIDVENLQLLSGGGGAHITGFFNTSGILTHDASTDTGTNVTVWDSLELAINTLRIGPALAEGDLWVFNPTDWSAIRRVKDAYGRFMVSADPSTDQVNEAWGIPVLATTQCPAKQGLLLDTTKFGYVGVREPLAMRIGYANDDLTRNILRFVGEERLTLCVTRPAAVLSITNLP